MWINEQEKTKKWKERTYFMAVKIKPSPARLNFSSPQLHTNLQVMTFIWHQEIIDISSSVHHVLTFSNDWDSISWDYMVIIKGLLTWQFNTKYEIYTLREKKCKTDWKQINGCCVFYMTYWSAGCECQTEDNF